MKLNRYAAGAAALLLCCGAHGQINNSAPTAEPVPAGLPGNPQPAVKAVPATTGSEVGITRSAPPRAENLRGGGYGMAIGGRIPGAAAPSAGITTTVTAGGVPPLVIRFSEAPAEQDAMMEEDLTIMSRIVERALDRGMGEGMPEKRMGIPLLYSSGGRSVRSLYLEGFGAAFMVKINQPVFAPAPAEKSQNPQPAAGNTDWDQARRELYGSADGHSFQVEGLKYDEKQVTALKRLLTQTFKSAANIRNLEPEEYVCFTLFGPSTVNAAAYGFVKGALAPAESDMESRQVAATKKKVKDIQQNVEEMAKTKTDQQPDMEAMHLKLKKAQDELKRAQEQLQRVQSTRNEYHVNDVRGGQERGTILTMRAKKKDIDALAQGTINFEAFEQKLEQQAYAGYGHGVTSVNSWVR